MSGELHVGMQGHRDEIALYQSTLASLGFNPGDIDGYFGGATLRAATAEVLANAEDSSTDLFPDEGVVLVPAFVRLGIAC